MAFNNMRYIQNRDSFKSGLIVKESIKPIKINEAKGESDNLLPNYKDSYGGRLLSFIFRKGTEKINAARVSKLLIDLENAINQSVIEGVKDNKEISSQIEETEKKSFISGIWSKIKSIKSKKDVEKLDEVIAEQATVVEEIPMNIQVVINYLDQRVININSESTTSTEKEEDKKEATAEQTEKSSTDSTINAGVNKITPETESVSQNFMIDLLSSKSPVEMLKDRQIKKQFFVDLKMLLNDTNYGQILVSYFDDKLKSDLNQLSIFAKKKTQNAGTEAESTTTSSTITDKNAGQQEKLDKISQLRQQRLQKAEELKNKPKSNKKDILANIEKIENKSPATHKVVESVDDIQGDTLSLRDDSVKKLMVALNKFFNDKRIKKQAVISKYFAKVNKLYQEYIGSTPETESESKPSAVSSELFNPEREVSKNDVQTLLPVLYKKMDEEQKEESVKMIKMLNQGVKFDGDTINIDEKFISDEAKKESTVNTEVSPEMDKEVEKQVKSAAIDPLEIVRVFNRANKLMVVNYMPANRSEGKVSRRTANDYETLDGGAPSLDNSNGPFRNKILWSKWNDGVLQLIKKYKEILDTTTIITYDNGKQEKKKANAPIVKFMNDMLNDSKATGGKEAHQTEFIESYFGIKKRETDAYSKGGYGYNGYGGDIFNPSNKLNKKEEITASSSNEGSFTGMKSDGTPINKIVLSKMRDASSGFAFSFQGIVNGIKAYEGKLVTLYCVGIKSYGKDHLLFKMSVNNDWFVQAYNSQIKYTSEREEDRKKNIVYLMLCNYDQSIVNGGILNCNIMQSVASDKIDDAEVLPLRVTRIKNLRILNGTDGRMMRMNKADSKRKTPKDTFYTKPDTFINIYNKLKNITNIQEGED